MLTPMAALCAMVVALTGLAVPAAAHPHAWIDLSVAIVFDENGRATGLRETWLLDEFYSAYAAQGRDKDGDGTPDQDQLEELLEVNLGNLKEYSYFTKAFTPTARLDFAAIDGKSTRMVGKRLEMAFFLPFAQPVDVAAGELTYAVFDPTYYIEVLHTETDVAIQLTGAPKGCRAALSPPNPDPATVSLAAALDRTQSAGDGLGTFFAETVVVRCD
jgi:ABC-type uncharacterized transport system substrate-binding protein